MVHEYIWEIYKTLISFGHSNSLEISFAIFAIAITSVLGLWFRRTKQVKRQKKDEIEKENNEIIRQGLQAQYKQAQHKLIEKKLSSEDRDKEKERESQTLMEIMKLLQNRKDLFPESSLDDLKQQLNLYRTQ